MDDLADQPVSRLLSGQRRFDLFRVAAPVLAAISLALAFAEASPSAQMKHGGIALMMMCMTAYVFHLQGYPISKRPPVVFQPVVLGYIGGFCFGSILCGFGMLTMAHAPVFGSIMMIAPTAMCLASIAFLRSAPGRRWRESVAKR